MYLLRSALLTLFIRILSVRALTTPSPTALTSIPSKAPSSSPSSPTPPTAEPTYNPIPAGSWSQWVQGSTSNIGYTTRRMQTYDLSSITELCVRSGSLVDAITVRWRNGDWSAQGGGSGGSESCVALPDNGCFYMIRVWRGDAIDAIQFRSLPTGSWGTKYGGSGGTMYVIASYTTGDCIKALTVKYTSKLIGIQAYFEQWTPVMTTSPTTASPTTPPTMSPTDAPSIPTAIPSAAPSTQTTAPTTESSAPTAAPSVDPSLAPTKSPSSDPSTAPSITPTEGTSSPTSAPTTPTSMPSNAPSLTPTAPTSAPTKPCYGDPDNVCYTGYYDTTNGNSNNWGCGKDCVGGRYRTNGGCGCACQLECECGIYSCPTIAPSKAPTPPTTAAPTSMPTDSTSTPSNTPTDSTSSPSKKPTNYPTLTTLLPTMNPSVSPTEGTSSPTEVTLSPTEVTLSPTDSTSSPSPQPTPAPSKAPSLQPTPSPSKAPLLFQPTVAPFDNLYLVIRYKDKSWTTWYSYKFQQESDYTDIMQNALDAAFQLLYGHSIMYSQDDSWNELGVEWTRAGMINVNFCSFSDVMLNDDCISYEESESNDGEEYVAVAVFGAAANEGLVEYVRYLRNAVRDDAFLAAFSEQMNDLLDESTARRRNLLANNFEVFSIGINDPINDIFNTEDASSDDSFLGLEGGSMNTASYVVIAVFILAIVLLVVGCVCCCKKRSERKGTAVFADDVEIMSSPSDDADDGDNTTGIAMNKCNALEIVSDCD